MSLHACEPHRVPERWRWPAGALVLSLALGGPAAAQPPGPAGPHATRAVQSFAELEASLLQAMRGRNVTLLAQLLDEDFQMIVAQEPDSPVAREDWLDNLRKTGAGDRVVQHLSVRELGGVAVAGFVLRGVAASSHSPPLYVVDTWQRAGAGWRLLTRQVAPASGARRGIPGDGPTGNVRKK